MSGFPAKFSLPRTFESLESSSTNSFEVKSERFREIIYVYKMRKQILIMMMTVLLMRIFLEVAMMMVMIFLEVVLFTESRFELGTQALGRD